MSVQQEKFKLYCPTSDQIDEIWDIAGPLIDKALSRGSNYTLDDVYAGLKAAEMQLWMWSDESAMVTTIQNKDERRWCLFLALGGEKMNDWINYLPIVEDWARTMDCHEMRIYGRPGWSRVIGYNIEYAKMVKRL